MEFKQMQYFLRLAEEGNVTRAARQLNIVQPALSMQIAKLEAEFGQKLFDRSAYGVTTTSAGETLARLTAPILRDVEIAMQEMARLEGRVSGRVTVGLITSVAQSTLATSSATVIARYPEVDLCTYDSYSEALTDWVMSGQLDLAIINVPSKRLPFTSHHILDEEMVLACRHDSPLVIPAKLNFEDLSRFELVTPSKRNGLRIILENCANAAGVKLKPRLELDTMSAICDVVATTDLVTILPTITLYWALAAGQVRAYRFASHNVTRSVAWIHHPRRAVSAVERAVVQIIRDDLVHAAEAASRYVDSDANNKLSAG